MSCYLISTYNPTRSPRSCTAYTSFHNFEPSGAKNVAWSTPHLCVNRLDHKVSSEAKIFHFLHTSTIRRHLSPSNSIQGNRRCIIPACKWKNPVTLKQTMGLQRYFMAMNDINQNSKVALLTKSFSLPLWCFSLSARGGCMMITWSRIPS